eukprot:s3160_g4.t1
MEFQVSLPSGRREIVWVLDSGTVADLKIAAEQSLGQPFLRLATAEGHLLDPTESLQLSGLQNGDMLTVVAQQPKIAATRKAFAMWCVGGNGIVTWGDPIDGGDSSRVQDQLRNVQHISGTDQAFAAILADGSVVTWGRPDYGYAFAAILADGTVVTWGEPSFGGDSSAVQDQLQNVQQEGGSVVTWGRPDYGGDSSRVRDQFSYM